VRQKKKKFKVKRTETKKKLETTDNNSRLAKQLRASMGDLYERLDH